jgi:hypothetical protein
MSHDETDTAPEPYRPQVGDVVAPWPGEDAGERLTVTATDSTHFIGRDVRGVRCVRALDRDWVKVESRTPINACWLNWYKFGKGGAYRTRREADDNANTGRLFVVHVGMRDGECFAEIEPLQE